MGAQGFKGQPWNLDVNLVLPGPLEMGETGWMTDVVRFRHCIVLALSNLVHRIVPPRTVNVALLVEPLHRMQIAIAGYLDAFVCLI